jgi:hypothetical protein
MSILLNINQNMELKMTEVTGLYERPSAPEGLKKRMRHDAVLRIRKDVIDVSDGLDIMIMEAKPLSGAMAAEKDKTKLRDAMCGNLHALAAKYPAQEALRTYGIQFTKFNVKLLEAQIVGKGRYAIYVVDSFVIPDKSCKTASSALLSMIMFKRRIVTTIEKIIDHK